MTPFLQSRGIRVIESDLGDRIQQLDGQPRSHIVFPAIHKTRQDAAHLFARTIGSDPDNDDPHALTEIMRNNARPRFLAAGAGMTGGNFAIVLRSSSHLPLAEELERRQDPNARRSVTGDRGRLHANRDCGKGGG